MAELLGKIEPRAAGTLAETKGEGERIRNTGPWVSVSLRPAPRAGDPPGAEVTHFRDCEGHS